MKSEDIGRFILRLAVGGLMLLHGIAKLRHGIGAIGSSVGSHSLPHWVAYGVYIGELLAPLLVIIGVFTRPAALIIAINMVFAVWLVHTRDLLHLGPGGGYALELQTLFFAGGLTIALFGAGRYAVGGGVGKFN